MRRKELRWLNPDLYFSGGTSGISRSWTRNFLSYIHVESDRKNGQEIKKGMCLGLIWSRNWPRRWTAFGFENQLVSERLGPGICHSSVRYVRNY